MDEAEQIAGRLSTKQIEQFLHPLLAEGWNYKTLMGETALYMPPDCIEHITTRPGYIKYCLTPLGLEVRKYLEENYKPQ